ncbi:hypothetical protein HMPREF1549_02253 [Actinomyces johnsonii F0510]|uniref:Uncharacterized protein n=1 Tax=Actinomyces johnsonii F0510 TaxID=1227262 RepID=U1PP18_9ACTO|nr:hypothetical protein HMPREF1549_02253 [Actinomyces johnsonii F0510]
MRSSLRCFFLAMRLRRFLMTDPMRSPRSSLRSARRPSLRAETGRRGLCHGAIGRRVRLSGRPRR